MSVEVRVVGANQLHALSKRLKEAGTAELRKELRTGIREGAKPAVEATKAAVRTIPVVGVRGGGHTARQFHHFERSKAKSVEARRAKARRQSGLRATIAGAISLQVTTSAVRIVVDEKKLPEDQRTLPRHLDSPAGWRHPVFGNDPWVKQYGRPWFESTINKFLPEVRKRVVQAMDDVAKKIEG